MKFNFSAKSIPLSPREAAEVQEKLLKGVIYRTSIVCRLYIFTFLAFGVYSASYIKIFQPEVTMWDNVWPRLIFNSLPFILVWFLFNSRRVPNTVKLKVWFLTLPLVLSAASCIYVWPLVIQGNWQLYLMVNTTNVYALSFWFIYGGPSIKHSLQMLAYTTLVFWTPLYYVLHESHNASVMNVFLNDNLMSVGINLFSSYTIYSLRRRLAIEDVMSKNEVKKFLGNRVAESVFEGRADLLADRDQNAFIISMDLRGYAGLMRELDSAMSGEFMESYHKSVNRIMGESGGYIHKTAGDGHLISFGLMDEDIDLSELKELAVQIESADLKRNMFFFAKAVQAIQGCVKTMDRLNEEYGLKSKVVVGAAIDFGRINVKVVGDAQFRKELDIFGSPIIRSVRMESYSKFIISQLKMRESIILLSKDMLHFALDPDQFTLFSTESNPIRDYPELDCVYFRKFADDSPILSIVTGANKSA